MLFFLSSQNKAWIRALGGCSRIVSVTLLLHGFWRPPDPCQPPWSFGKTWAGREISRICCFHLRTGCCYYPPNKPTPHPSAHSISLMLRTSLRSVRGLSSRSVAAAPGRQWQQAAAAARPAGLAARVSLAIWAREAATVVDSWSDWLTLHRDALPTPHPGKSLNPQLQRQTRRLRAKHPPHLSRTASTPKPYPPRTCL
jgi:hypothetical protein